jgi:protein-arginine kinase activator protein McsA
MSIGKQKTKPPNTEKCNTCGKSIDSKTNGLFECEKCYNWRYSDI